MNDETNEEVTELPEIMDGTYCEDCYIVFAKHEGFKIGIRPLLDMGYDSTYVGFRIRAVPDEQDADFTDGDAIAAAFPNFDFRKSSAKRCSFMGGLFVNRTRYQPEDVQDFITVNRVVGKVISALKEYLQEIPFVQEAETYEYLTLKYEELIGEQGVEVEKKADLPDAAGTVVYMSDYEAKQAFDEEIGTTNADDDESEEEAG